MQHLKTLITVLALTLSACSTSVGSQESALGGHTAVVDVDTVSVSLAVEPSLADTLQAQTDIRSLDSIVRLEVIGPEGCSVHEATLDSLRSGQSALHEAFFELDQEIRDALLEGLPEHHEDLASLDSDDAS